MIIPMITPAQANAGRRKNLTDHIRSLELRYSEQARRESVALLEELLAQRIEETKQNGFQTE